MYLFSIYFENIRGISKKKYLMCVTALVFGLLKDKRICLSGVLRKPTIQILENL